MIKIKIKKVKQPNPERLKEYYQQLNERQKEVIRNNFLETFELSQDSFYRIINEKRELKRLEKTFFSKALNISESKLFPKK